MTETLTVIVEIDQTKLPGRRCNRCNGIEFRSIVFTMDYYTARCANCIFHGYKEPCGTIMDFTISDKATVKNCGDVYPTGYGTDQSHSTVPLAICLKCHKITLLQ